MFYGAMVILRSLFFVIYQREIYRSFFNPYIRRGWEQLFPVYLFLTIFSRSSNSRKPLLVLVVRLVLHPVLYKAKFLLSPF